MNNIEIYKEKMFKEIKHIDENGDSKKESVALGQTYFAIQTRKQELTKDGNKVLYKVAKEKGVKNFDKFTNAGYEGLYNGETADDIAKRKGLRYREDILDNMGSVELGGTMPEDLLTPNKSLKEIEKEMVNKVLK